MNLKKFWERHRAQYRSITTARPSKTRPPKPFQPLTREESLALLNGAIEWFTNEITTMLAMPEGGLKEHRRLELRARHQSFVRDYQWLVGGQEV